MTKYEIVCILNSTSNINELKNKIKNILINKEGSIIEENDWGIKPFSYEIQKQKEGFYFILIANTSSENLNELNRIVGISKDILRVMIINTENEKNYIQTTKLSSTEIKSDKIEHKTIGKKYKKRTFDLSVENDNNKRENNRYNQKDNRTYTDNNKKEFNTENNKIETKQEESKKSIEEQPSKESDTK